MCVWDKPECFAAMEVADVLNRVPGASYEGLVPVRWLWSKTVADTSKRVVVFPVSRMLMPVGWFWCWQYEAFGDSNRVADSSQSVVAVQGLPEARERSR